MGAIKVLDPPATDPHSLEPEFLILRGENCAPMSEESPVASNSPSRAKRGLHWILTLWMFLSEFSLTLEGKP